MPSNVSTDREFRNKIAVFPGTFDPFTRGHTEIIRKVMMLDVFDEVHILVASNSGKSTPMFSTDVRMDIVYASLEGDMPHREKLFVRTLEPNLTTMQYCAKVGAEALIRGLRDVSDLSYEQNLEHINHRLNEFVQTLYIMSDPQIAYISSTLVREMLRYNVVFYGNGSELFGTKEAFQIAIANMKTKE